MATDQILHAGGEGVVLIGGHDYGSMGWDATETVEYDEYTSTKHFFPGDGDHGKTYQSRWPCKWSLSGTTKFKFDSNDQPFPAIEAGKVVALKLFMAYLGSNLQVDQANITNVPINNPGPNGTFEITINWEARGRYVKNVA